MAVKTENVKWVDGLRGLASFLVVLTHLTRAYDQQLFWPAGSDGETPRFLQWPIVRVFFHGRIGVAVFSVVTGYVCALKPIRQAKSGNPEGSLTSIAKSAARRIPRLVLPTTIATIIIWFMAQLGAFQIARHASSFWLNTTSPGITPYFGDAVHSLVYNMITTWTRSANEYDPNQWTLQPLLKGSMMVYVSMAATVYMQPKYRMMTSLAQFVYYYCAGDATFGMQFFFGMFLADFQVHYGGTPSAIQRSFLSPLLILLGLILNSYPEDHAEWAPWSKAMQSWAGYIVPAGNDASRYFTAFGLDLICFGIHYSPSMKDFLANKYLLWLGKNSFAVYLLHGSLIRSILVWVLFGIKPPAPVQNDKGEWQNGPQLQITNPWWIAVWLPPWFVLLYTIANLWTQYVDPMCARWTESFIKYVNEGTSSEKPNTILLK